MKKRREVRLSENKSELENNFKIKALKPGEGNFETIEELINFYVDRFYKTILHYSEDCFKVVCQSRDMYYSRECLNRTIPLDKDFGNVLWIEFAADVNPDTAIKVIDGVRKVYTERGLFVDDLTKPVFVDGELKYYGFKVKKK